LVGNSIVSAAGPGEDALMRIFRVTVRGWFHDLTDQQRAALLAVADDHDVVSVGAFTETGTLTYERALHTFTFRVQLRGDGEDAEEVVLQRATGMAMAQVTELGVEHRDVRARAHDMADVWA
jgi:hypothetical protein